MERRMNEIERRQDTLEHKVDKLSDKIDIFVDEMRAMGARHDAELRELRDRREEDRREFDAKFDKIENKMDGIMKHVQNLTVAVAVGIGAIVVAILMK